MPDQRQSRASEIKTALGEREIVWFGTRGTDVEPLLSLREPQVIICQVAPLPGALAGTAEQDCLEDRTRRRVDLDSFDIDLDMSQEGRGLKLNLLRKVEKPVALVAYRAAEFLASVAFTNPKVQLFAPFHLSQRLLEHKPWVEQNLARQGLPMLTITYIRDGDLEAVEERLQGGPLVGRTNTGAGGAGVFVVRSVEDLLTREPEHHDGFIGFSDYLEGAAPLNVNACVYNSGEVAVFGVSYQLVGVRECTFRPMGYCGNDFLAAGGLAPELLDEVEQVASKIGKWLHRLGFLGVFGLDLLVHGDRLVITELNPRYQGSTPLSAIINQALGWTDPFAEHVAAYLGLMRPADLPSCRVQTLEARSAGEGVPVAQIVHHNVTAQAMRVRAHRQPAPGSGITLACVPHSDVYVESNAILAKSLHRGRVTEDGYTLMPQAQKVGELFNLGF